MTNLERAQLDDGGHGLGWVTLADGVRVDPAWLARYVPRLFSAWQRADTVQRRQLAQLIQRAGADPDQGRDTTASCVSGGPKPADWYTSPYDTTRKSGPASTPCPTSCAAT